MIRENTFRTKVTDIDFYGWRKGYKDNCEIEGEAYVEWEFYVEYRSWGVKTISCYATNIEVEYKVIKWMDDGDDIEEDFTIDTKLSLCEHWEIESNTDELKFGDDINPQNLQLDFDTNTITINF